MATRTDPIQVSAGNLSELSCRTTNGTITLTTDPAATGITGTATVTLRASTKAEAEGFLKELTISTTVVEGRAKVLAKHPLSWSKTNFANRPGSIKIDFQLTGPPGIAYDLNTVNGDITVVGDTANLSCNTTNGDIDAGSGVGGEARFENKSGAINGIIGNAERVSVTSGSGKIKLTSTATEPFTGRYTVVCTNGDMDIALPQITSGSAHLRTANGDITATLPSSSTITLNAVTSNGKVELNGTLTKVVAQDAKSLVGELGAPHGEVELNTTNGDVSLTLLP